jgi:LPXTG-motif cell wall-anchored protein
MRWFLWLLTLLACLLLATPALAAESFEMSCPRCDHVDAVATGLEPNATLVLVVRDVRTGQPVIPNPTMIKTDASGRFSGEFPVDLAAHPSLEGAIYNRNGTDLVLDVHTTVEAPAHCARAANLPYTGSTSRLLALVAATLIGGGAVLVRATALGANRRSGA